MLKLPKINNLLSRYRNDERGNVAMLFAGSAVVVIGTMGAAMDFSTLSNAKARSQSIADATALSAAIFVRDNDRPPTNLDEGFTQGQHSADSLGYEFKGFVEGGARNVDVNIVYDDNSKEARVTVSGSTIPTFIQVLGKRELDFTSESVVSYLDVDDKHPASITLVLDNSGSMAWDDKLAESDGSSPDDAAPRIEGLQFSVNRFNAELSARLGTTDDDGYRTIRSGMLPYSSDIVAFSQVQMKPGYITPEEAARMIPAGNTNSNPPMERAKQWLDGENEQHRTEARRVDVAYREPLKFVIFMSDGQNTIGNFFFTADNTAPTWWRQLSNGLWQGRYATDNFNGGFGYQRGHLRRNSDLDTINTCTTLKNQGTAIYTIGYALELGNYNANNPNNPNQTKSVDLWNQTNAFNLLQSCASKPENFVRAADNEELESAFDTIQNAIVKELIRIKS